MSNSGLRRETDTIDYLEMVRYSRISAHDHLIADFAASCDSGLSAQDAIRTYGRVVSDLTEVIDFRSDSYRSTSECGAINASVGAHLDSIA